MLSEFVCKKAARTAPAIARVTDVFWLTLWPSRAKHSFKPTKRQEKLAPLTTSRRTSGERGETRGRIAKDHGSLAGAKIEAASFKADSHKTTRSAAGGPVECGVADMVKFLNEMAPLAR
jgi:hypothetical protein